MSHKPEETGLVKVGQPQMELKEVKELVALEGDENLLRQVMSVSAGLYSDYEKKKAELEREKAEIERKNAEATSGLEALERAYFKERDAIYLADVPNPHEALREYAPNVTRVRGELLNYFFQTRATANVQRMIDEMHPSQRTVRNILKTLLRDRIDHFIGNFTFDTSFVDPDLEMLIKTFVPGSYQLRQGDKDAYAEHHGGRQLMTLKRSSAYPLAHFLRIHSHAFGHYQEIRQDELDAQIKSEEWLDKLVSFVMATRGGNERVNNFEEVLAYLVRFTKLIDLDRKYWARKEGLQNLIEEVPNENTTRLKLRYSDELMLKFPNLRNTNSSLDPYMMTPRRIPVRRGGKPVTEYPDDEKRAMDPRVDNKRKPATHVIEEFAKVTYKKWEEGDHKEIIGEISRAVNVQYGEFEELRDLKERKGSALVKHLPTVAGLTSFKERHRKRLAELEEKYAKPDAYAEKLYDLYNLAIYYHNIGKTLLDKGADDQQRDMGLKYMLFAAGLTRVLDLMVAQLEVKLAVQKVSREFGMSEFVKFAEALETLAKDPLSNEVEKVIGDSMDKFRAAIETERA